MYINWCVYMLLSLCVTTNKKISIHCFSLSFPNNKSNFVLGNQYVSHEGACASPHAACVAALRLHCPKLQVSVYTTSRAMSSVVCLCNDLMIYIYKYSDSF